MLNKASSKDEKYKCTVKIYYILICSKFKIDLAVYIYKGATSNPEVNEYFFHFQYITKKSLLFHSAISYIGKKVIRKETGIHTQIWKNHKPNSPKEK
jgi:hypothetical protein